MTIGFLQVGYFFLREKVRQKEACPRTVFHSLVLLPVSGTVYLRFLFDLLLRWVLVAPADTATSITGVASTPGLFLRTTSSDGLQWSLQRHLYPAFFNGPVSLIFFRKKFY